MESGSTQASDDQSRTASLCLPYSSGYRSHSLTDNVIGWDTVYSALS